MLKIIESAEVYGMIDVMALGDMRREGMVSFWKVSGKMTLLLCAYRTLFVLSENIFVAFFSAAVVSSCAKREKVIVQNTSMLHILTNRDF